MVKGMKIFFIKFVTVSYAFTSCRKRWPTKLADSNKLQRIDAKPNRETDAEFPIKIAPGSYLIYRMHFRMLPGHRAAMQSILESVTIKWCNFVSKHVNIDIRYCFIEASWLDGSAVADQAACLSVFFWLQVFLCQSVSYYCQLNQNMTLTLIEFYFFRTQIVPFFEFPNNLRAEDVRCCWNTLIKIHMCTEYLSSF